MSNLTSFNRVVTRAQQAEEKRVGFNDSIRLEVPTTVILFANDHILALEEQLSKLQEQVRRLRIESVTVSGEELNRQHAARTGEYK